MRDFPFLFMPTTFHPYDSLLTLIFDLHWSGGLYQGTTCFFFLLVIFGSRPAKNWEEEIYVDFVIEFPYENSFNFLSLVSEFKLKVGFKSHKHGTP